VPSQRAFRDRAVRELYERYPYPETPIGRPAANWRIPAPSWLVSLWRPGVSSFQPSRVLVAGCGSGREAFAVARRLPAATIVAVDFSPRSIRVAQAAQRRLPFANRIRFLVADLGSRRLAQATGGAFDFISCHGVLSYVADPTRVLRNLRACLTDDGALYLGVNGREHHSVRWRAALPAFGLNVGIWRESTQSRRVLRVFDAMAARTPTPRLANKSASYLSGDVFGPPFLNLPLAEWMTMARRAGLHLLGSESAGESLRGLCDEDLVPALIPRTRAEVHELEERLLPVAFHRLLLARRPPIRAPWDDAQALFEWQLIRLPLFRVTLPLRLPGTARFASRALNLLVESRIDAALAAALRGNGRGTIREVVRRAGARVDARALRDALYMLYLLGVIELRHPSADTAA
jgi:SAM-dependent methyltransferase